MFYSNKSLPYLSVCLLLNSFLHWDIKDCYTGALQRPPWNDTTQFQCNKCSVAKSFLTLQPHGLQHTRLPCSSLSPGDCANPCPFSWWCHPTISSSVIPFSSCLQSFPASGSFPMSRLFASGGQSTGVSASVLPMNIQGWFPLGLTGITNIPALFKISV